MNFFYSPTLSADEPQVTLSPEESHHLARVFRKGTGEKIFLTNGKGLVASAEVIATDPRGTTCRILQHRIHPPLQPAIHVGLATLRPNRMDWAVEKLTELGVASIRALRTRHTSVHAFKQSHLQKVAVSALKQSGQAYLPLLEEPVDFAPWLADAGAASGAMRLLAHLGDAAAPISNIKPVAPKEIWLAIGPEGGFSEEETRQAVAAGFQLIRLSETVLRAETAAVVAVAQLILSFR